MPTLPLSNAFQDARLPSVAILLCTYNGAKFLEEQLDSFERQTHANWRVWASDDGSTDDTLAILQRYQEKWGSERLTIINGPRAGSTRNFMSLLKSPDIQATYYSFSDQDDIWESKKLEHALQWMERQNQGLPLLYGSRTLLVDETNHEIGPSHTLKRPPGLLNALVQNVISGNTMVFNDMARRLAARPDTDVVIHDWWMYLVVSACGGIVHYDNYPSLRYRQHQNNQIGMGSGFASRLMRLRKLFSGRLKTSVSTNIAALQTLENNLTPQSQELIYKFAEARKKAAPTRLVALKQLGVYRQSTVDHAGMFAAALLNKL